MIDKDSAGADILILILNSSTNHKSKRPTDIQTLQIDTVSQKIAILYLSLGGVVFISSLLQSV
jgi:hypothetical protein